ncbi:MAG: AI-2E family transporter [Lachnospiraceae bacterium]|nr:AI-2E family transporter [Lachnospiraceae bacterium]
MDENKEEQYDYSEYEEAKKKRARHPLWSNKLFQYGFTAFAVFVCCMVFYYLLFHFKNFTGNLQHINKILSPIFMGLVIAYLLAPVLNFIEQNWLISLCEKFKWEITPKRRKHIRSLGVLITVVMVLGLLAIFLWMFLSQIIPSIANVVSNFNTYTNNFVSWVRKLLDNNPDMSSYITANINRFSKDIESWVRENVMSKTSKLLTVVSTSFLSFLSGLWNFIIGFIISIYVLGAKEKLVARMKKCLYAFANRRTSNRIVTGLRFSNKTFSGFIVGKLIDSLIIGMLCFIGTTLMQTPYPALVSLIIGVTNIIPFFGPYIGGIPTIILVFAVNPMEPKTTLYYALFIILLQQFDGNILGPKILGDSTGLEGFFVIFSITLFGGLWGIFGMVIGVPLFAVIYAGVREIANRDLEKKGYPILTDDYKYLGKMNKDGTYETYTPSYLIRKPKKGVHKTFPFFPKILKKKKGE